MTGRVQDRCIFQFFRKIFSEIKSPDGRKNEFSEKNGKFRKKGGPEPKKSIGKIFGGKGKTKKLPKSGKKEKILENRKIFRKKSDGKNIFQKKEEKPAEKEPPGGIGKFSDRKTEKGDKKSGIFKKERRKKAGFPISFPIFLREKRHPAGCLIGFLNFSRCTGRKLLSPDFSGGVPFPGRKYSAKRIQRPSWSACCACPFPYRRESVPPWTPG